MKPSASTYSVSPARTRLVLKGMALLVLLVGLATAAGLWLRQNRAERQASAQRASHPPSANLVEPLSPEDSRRYTHEAELYYGKTGMLLDKATRWLESLSHGKPLAWTVGGVSVVVAAGLHFLARICRLQPNPRTLENSHPPQ